MRVSPNKRGKISARPNLHASGTCIRISAKDDREIPGTNDHDSSTKIKVSTTDEWDNIWYKDEGGRIKVLEVTLEAYDKDNLVVPEKYPESQPQPN
jgi:hypothetical protein